MKQILIIFYILILCNVSSISENLNAQTPINNFKKVIIHGNFKAYKSLDTLNIIAIKSYLIDLNDDQVNDTLILENLKDLVGDPQLYTIIDLKLSSGERYLLKNIAGKRNDLHSKVGFKDRLNSDLLYIPELKDGKCLFFIWAFQYPDCSAQFEIIQFGQEGFKSLFKKDIYIKKISSLNDEKSILLEGTVDCDKNKLSAIVKID